MAPYDPWAGINSRFEGLEGRLTAHEDRMTALRNDLSKLETTSASMHQQIEDMTDAFRAFRTALYTVAGTILAAAVLVLLLGHA